MAKVWVQEFGGVVLTSGGASAAVGLPPLVQQSFSYTTSTQSNAFNSKTRMIRVWADSTVYIEVGDNPTATGGSLPIASNKDEYFFVQPGAKLAAYDGSS